MAENHEVATPGTPKDTDSFLPDGYSEFLTHNALKFAEDIGNKNVVHQGRLKRLRNRYTKRQQRKRVPPPTAQPEKLKDAEGSEVMPEEDLKDDHEPQAFEASAELENEDVQDENGEFELPNPSAEGVVFEPPQHSQVETIDEGPDVVDGASSMPQMPPEETDRERQMREQRARMRERWTNVPSETTQGSRVLHENMDAVKAATIAGLDALLFSVPEVLKKAEGGKNYSMNDSIEYLQDLRLKAQTYHAEQRKFKELQMKFTLGTKVVSTLASKLVKVDGLEQNVRNDMHMFLPALQRMANEQAWGNV